MQSGMSNSSATAAPTSSTGESLYSRALSRTCKLKLKGGNELRSAASGSKKNKKKAKSLLLLTGADAEALIGKSSSEDEGEEGGKKRKRRMEPRDGEGEGGGAEGGEGDEVEAEETAEVKEASGRVVSTGTTLQGFETKFMDELSPGDVVLLQHPASLQVEGRSVVGILSNRSLTLAAPFSSDLISTTFFHIRKDSVVLKKRAEREVMIARRKRKKELAERGEGEGDEDAEDDPEVVQDEVSKALQKKLKTATQNKYMSVREKTGMWGYRTVNKLVRGEVSAEKMLDIRCKQGRDKFCF